MTQGEREHKFRTALVSVIDALDGYDMPAKWSAGCAYLRRQILTDNNTENLYRLLFGLFYDLCNEYLTEEERAFFFGIEKKEEEEEK